MSYIGIPPFGQTIRTLTNITATASQTTFNITGGYIVGYVDVYLNGVLLTPSDYTATDGLTVVLSTGAAASDEFQAISYQPVSLTNALPTVGGTLTGDVTTTANINFGDNDKAQFGASNDLQIYHDGSNSYVSDEGTGTLRVRSSNQLVLQVGDDAGGWENAILADNNAGVALRYNNATKLSTTGTGVDVTGVLIATSGLKFGAGESYIYESATDRASLRIGADGPYVVLGQDLGTNVAAMGNASGATALYGDNAEVMRLSAGNVGIGTTSPSVKLDVVGTSRYTFNVANAYTLQTSINAAGSAFADDYKNALSHIWQTSGTERMRITSAGNVGIGTSSPSSLLDIVGSSPRIGFTDTGTGVDHRVNADSSVGAFALDIDYNSEGSDRRFVVNIGGSERMRIDSSGNVGIGTSSPSNKLKIYDSTATSTTFKANTLLNVSSNGSGADATINLTDGVANNAVISQLSGQLLFGTGAGTPERMRIDGSGNVGIGTSSPSCALDVTGTVTADGSITISDGSTAQLILDDTGQAQDWSLKAQSNYVGFFYGSTQVIEIDNSSNLLFNSGYGSVAKAYGCRAWVNFNGTGTVAIRASGNVSSITDNGTGNYTVNFTTAMPDTNYGWEGSARFNTTTEANGILSTRSNDAKTSSTLQVRSFDCAIASTTNPIDSSEINVTVFR